MDLQIDVEKIKSQRKARAWSQEHLAHVAGLGRRTIQRMEKTGAGSYETAQAIASALDLNVTELTDTETLQIDSIRKQNALLRKISIALSSLVVLMLFALTRSVTAEQIKLEIQAIVDSDNQTQASITNKAGLGNNIQLADDFEITVTPTITGQGDVQLEIQLMRLDGEDFKQVGKPVVRTPEGEPALIKSASNNGQSLTLEITPSIL